MENYQEKLESLQKSIETAEKRVIEGENQITRILSLEIKISENLLKLNEIEKSQRDEIVYINSTVNYIEKEVALAKEHKTCYEILNFELTKEREKEGYYRKSIEENGNTYQGLKASSEKFYEKIQEKSQEKADLLIIRKSLKTDSVSLKQELSEIEGSIARSEEILATQTDEFNNLNSLQEISYLTLEELTKELEELILTNNKLTEQKSGLVCEERNMKVR